LRRRKRRKKKVVDPTPRAPLDRFLIGRLIEIDCAGRAGMPDVKMKYHERVKLQREGYIGTRDGGVSWFVTTAGSTFLDSKVTRCGA
jgi:hypothetical protein